MNPDQLIADSEPSL